MPPAPPYGLRECTLRGQTVRCLRRAACTTLFGNAVQSFSSKQIQRDRVCSRRQVLEPGPDHELGNDCLDNSIHSKP